MELGKRNRGVLTAAVVVLTLAATTAAVAVPGHHRGESRLVVEASPPPAISETIGTSAPPTTATTEIPAQPVTTTIVRPTPPTRVSAPSTTLPNTMPTVPPEGPIDPSTGLVIGMPSRPAYPGTVPVDTGRPPCPGTPDGLYGAGCVVTATVGGISIVLSEYGQVLQVNRDPAQLRVGPLAPQVAVRQWRFDYGIGDNFEASIPDCNRDRQPGLPVGWRTYPSTGVFQITLTVTAGLCDAAGWSSEQTFSVVMPVRVCSRIETINNQVYCVEP